MSFRLTIKYISICLLSLISIYELVYKGEAQEIATAFENIFENNEDDYYVYHVIPYFSDSTEYVDDAALRNGTRIEEKNITQGIVPWTYINIKTSIREAIKKFKFKIPSSNEKKTTSYQFIFRLSLF